jgi:subtilisin family serine protease
VCAGERIRAPNIEGYQLATGTSFAAPFVAAAAALLVSRAQTRSAPLDPATVKHLLMASARPHVAGVADGNGAGVLDAAKALELLDQALDTDPTTDIEEHDDG